MARALPMRLALGALGAVDAAVSAAASWLPFTAPSAYPPPYPGATQTRRGLGFAPAYGPNRAIAASADVLRARSRDLLRRNPYVRRGIKSVVANIIGTGITPFSHIEDEALWALVHDTWDAWVTQADANGVQDYYGLQRSVCRARIIGGECFVRFRPRRPEDGLTIPLQLQILSPEYCPLEKNETLPNNAGFIRQGIQFGPIGNITGYWFYRSHPLDDALTVGANDVVFVPASEVLHIFDPGEGDRVRGEPELATAILPAHDFDQYDDATMQRAKTGAYISGVIKKTALDGQLPPTVTADTKANATTGVAEQVWEPGTLFELHDNEDIAFPPMPDLGTQYEAFQKRQLQKMSAGCGNLYEHLSGDYAGITFSSVRAAINDMRQQWDQDQWLVQIPQFDERVWARFLEAAVLAGRFEPALSARRFTRERETLLRHEWIPCKRPQVNPLEDTQRDREEVEAGFSSEVEQILARGLNPRRVAQQQALSRRLGLGPVGVAQASAESTGQRAEREEAARGPVRRVK